MTSPSTRLSCRLYDMVKAHGMEMLTYQDEKIAATRKANKYVLHEAFINKMLVVEYADFVNEVRYPINKCLVVGDPAPLHQLELQVVEAFRGRMDAYRSAGFLPSSACRRDRQEQLPLAAAHQDVGISREQVIACGDGYNDQSMIEFAGLWCRHGQCAEGHPG